MCDPKHDKNWDHSRQTHDIPSFSWVTDVYFHQRKSSRKTGWFLVPFINYLPPTVGPFNPFNTSCPPRKPMGFFTSPKEYQPATMASINFGGWHLPPKKNPCDGHTLYRSNTLPNIPIVLPKKNMCLKALPKKNKSPLDRPFFWFLPVAPKVTQGQIGPSQFGSGDDPFHLTSFLLGATHGHPVTWLRWSCRALKPWEDSWIEKSWKNSNGCVQCVYSIQTIDAWNACICMNETSLYESENLDASPKYGGFS